jgi:hypothetical protein
MGSGSFSHGRFGRLADFSFNYFERLNAEKKPGTRPGWNHLAMDASKEG